MNAVLVTIHINTLQIMDEKERIEKVMQVENMNSAQFAAEIGIQSSTLSHILNGRNNPSLDVLKRILNRFKNISPEWLILDEGSMYRTVKNSQMPSLFDFEDKNDSKSVDYTPNQASKTSDDIEHSTKKEEIADNREQNESTNTAQKVGAVQQEQIALSNLPGSKSISKIIVYYSDTTYQEFLP